MFAPSPDQLAGSRVSEVRRGENLFIDNIQRSRLGPKGLRLAVDSLFRVVESGIVRVGCLVFIDSFRFSILI